MRLHVRHRPRHLALTCRKQTGGGKRRKKRGKKEKEKKCRGSMQHEEESLRIEQIEDQRRPRLLYSARILPPPSLIPHPHPQSLTLNPKP
eukprot:3418629-Rhodomonas_salina.1